VQQIQYEVYISVGQIPSLEGENHRFWFWLVKSELEPGLKPELGFQILQRNRTKLEPGSWFFKNQNWNWIWDFWGEKKWKKGLEQEQDPGLWKSKNEKKGLKLGANRQLTGSFGPENQNQTGTMSDF
jgi:hypothetical protein